MMANFDPIFGIPAAIVTNFLIDNNIVCEKTDYYSFLLLNSLGTTKAKQGSLLTALFKFKQLFDSNAPLSEAAPKLVAAYPEKYSNITLKEHCLAMHNYIVKHHLLDTMQKAFEAVPEMVYKPADAFHKVIAGEYEYVKVDDLLGKIAGVMLVPYPPGIPILMGGERITDKSKAIIDYLKRREEFENEFPGYEGDIHGVERVRTPDGVVFKTMCLK
jgi:lysine decarboxylase/arginine decarboxylase